MKRETDCFSFSCDVSQIWDACSDAVITFNEDLYDTEVAFIVENDLLVHAVSERLSESASAQTLYETKVDKVLIPTRHAETSKITLNSGREIEARLLVSFVFCFSTTTTACCRPAASVARPAVAPLAWQSSPTFAQSLTSIS